MELARLIRVLQGHICSLDPLKRQTEDDAFDANEYIRLLVERVKHEEGVMLIAEDEGKPVGFVAGIIQREEEDPLERLSGADAVTGRVLELVVESAQRGKSVGSELMLAMEQYFRTHGCELIRVNCFAPNTGAHAFYRKLGFGDRAVDLLKML